MRTFQTSSPLGLSGGCACNKLDEWIGRGEENLVIIK